jgi:tetratricopeptide (TPR) repeat protein
MRAKAGSIVAVLLAVLLAGGSVSPAVHAQKKEDAPPAGAGTIDAGTGKILTEAIEFLNKENYGAAKASIGRIKMDGLSPYERSRVEQILASIAHAQERYGEARQHLQAAISAGGLNDVEISNSKYQIAQLFLAEEKWKEGAAALESWFATSPKPNSAAYYLLAVAYYQQGLYAKAEIPAQKAVDLAEKPQESWIQLVLALRLQQEHYKEAVPLLERLIAMVPDKKAYWSQLSSVYGQIENYQKSLAVLQLAYNAGLITDESEVRRLADLQLYNDAPYRCATTIDEGIQKKYLRADFKLYEKQANCWIAAREYEKSITPLSRAAQMASNGDLMMRLGEVQVQRNEWNGAIDAFHGALRKGGLRDTGNAHLMLGISYFNLKKMGEARAAFERARGFPKHSRMAEGYLQIIRAQQAA